MPILRLDIVENDTDTPCYGRQVIQELADGLGSLFGTGPAGTWVQVRYLPRDSYAENDTVLDGDVLPVFVHVLKARVPEPPSLRTEAAAIAALVARVLDRPQDNVHVIYEPPGAGRVAFGGKLVDG
jgi:phenylpyruvate tautomerase PptA (4-oxalocrotonate tautomerase family)